MRDFFMAAPYWPGVRPGLSHHSFYTSSEEPPLSNFNSYWDIPPEQWRNGFFQLLSIPRFNQSLSLFLASSRRHPQEQAAVLDLD
jgi:hypothetical protein